ncbi:MAG: S8 family serine peptidase [Cytophagales bacterium]|nr:S8 family serine peptidase [Cytophagales bacterium]
MKRNHLLTRLLGAAALLLATACTPSDGNTSASDPSQPGKNRPQRPAAYRPAAPKAPLLSPGLEQVNGQAFAGAGLSGKNVKIGIIDAGFSRANQDPSLAHLFKQHRVLGGKDYIYPAAQDLYANRSDMDWHGTSVWRYIGGKDNINQYGLAHGAAFFLARTDNGTREFAAEQEYFRQALGWLHAQGVRLVHTSLGYAYGFDNPGENYVPENMDGKSTLITKAVQEAITRYNMIVVVSAGNDGNNPWKVVSAPADSEGVITVGAADRQGAKQDFSSEGPDFLPYLKPNVSCLNATGGTSFSAPVITSLVACLLEKKPDLSSRKVRELLEKSAHLYPYGNNYLGYGVPDAGRMLTLLDNPDHDFGRAERLQTRDSLVTIALGKGSGQATLFHKKDKWVVLKQEQARAANQSLTVRRPSGLKRTKLVVDDKTQSKYHTEEHPEKVRFTTVSTPEKVIEISWQ